MNTDFPDRGQQGGAPPKTWAKGDPLPGVEQLKIDPPAVIPDGTWSNRLAAVPAFELDYGEFAHLGLSLRAASLRGVTHDQLSDPRQDAYAIRTADGVIGVAVCDGVGSKQLSHVGARVAADAAAEACVSSNDLDSLTVATVDALQRSADSFETSMDDFSTTLCAIRVETTTVDRSWRVQIAQWGDTEALCFDPAVDRDGHPDWNRCCPDPPYEEQKLLNATRALPASTSPDAQNGSFEWRPGQVLCILTDGIAADLDFNTDVGHSLAHAWFSVPSPWEFAGSVAYLKLGAIDDRTAVVLWRS